MTTTQPREQLPPLTYEDWMNQVVDSDMLGAPIKRRDTSLFSGRLIAKQAWEAATEALRAQAASVEAVGEDALRIMFEANMSDNGKWANATMRAPKGGYLLMRTAVAWEDWKACAAALQATPAHIPADVSPPQAPQAVVDAQIEAAAKVIAACMDYPWDHMPEQGRQSMREHARKVAAALAIKGQQA